MLWFVVELFCEPTGIRRNSLCLKQPSSGPLLEFQRNTRLSSSKVPLSFVHGLNVVLKTSFTNLPIGM